MQDIYTHMRTHVMTWFTCLYTSVELLAVPFTRVPRVMRLSLQWWQQHYFCRVSLISACKKLHACKAHLVVLQEKNNGELFSLVGSPKSTAHCITVEPHCTDFPVCRRDFASVEVTKSDRLVIQSATWLVQLAAVGCIDAQILWNRESLVYRWFHWHNKATAE